MVNFPRSTLRVIFATLIESRPVLAHLWTPRALCSIRTHETWQFCLCLSVPDAIRSCGCFCMTDGFDFRRIATHELAMWFFGAPRPFSTV